MALEPAQHCGMFMDRVVVPDQVQRPGRRGVLIEQREEPQPFLMAMPTLTCPDQLAREDIERGKQGRRAMAFRVMGHRRPAALSSRAALAECGPGLCLADSGRARPHQSTSPQTGDRD